MPPGRWTLVALALSSCLLVPGCGAGDGITIQGAGATFPAPLYKRWFMEYYRQHPNVRVNYQPIGSGAGIRQFTELLVTFGASDAYLSDKEKEKISVERGVILLPMTAGSIVVCYNVPGAPDGLKLTRKTYIDIFLGKITSWNDPAIAASNPGVALPDLAITVVQRADGSGTTHAFTSHLSAISPEWKKEVGAGKSVKWPTGVGGRGNPGVAALIQQTPGAIGYLEYGYADLGHLPMAALENRWGEDNQQKLRRSQFVRATPESGNEALKGGKIPADFNFKVFDPPGEKAYPIVTYTWLLCYRYYPDARSATELKNVIRFALGKQGQSFAGDLGYIPLPDEVSRRVLKALDEIKP